MRQLQCEGPDWVDSKQEHRQQLRHRRDTLSAQQQDALSAAVWQLFIDEPSFSSVLFKGSRLALYAALPGEVQTHGLYTALRARGIICCFPRVDKTMNRLVFSDVADYGDLRPGVWGILEPSADAPTVTSQQIALVVVPGLAFDRRLQRLGHGKGYYDRFLSTYSGIRVGFAYALQCVDALPAESHDQTVDKLVTEKGVAVPGAAWGWAS